MQRLEVSGAVRLIYGSLGVKGLSSELFAVQVVRCLIDFSSRTSHCYGFEPNSGIRYYFENSWPSSRGMSWPERTKAVASHKPITVSVMLCSGGHCREDITFYTKP